MQEWADSENRTLSNLMETLTENAIASRKNKTATKKEEKDK
ncbi:ribbon-helix-helix domain-containing protein [Salmonella enterica]